MNKALKIIIEVFIYLIVVAVLLEIALRIFTGLVPIKLLAFMGEEVRGEIAENRQLARLANHYFLERDDGGPAMPLRRPNVEAVYPAPDHGMVEKVVMDNQGFCNPEINSYEKDKIQIISVGDSFTWCTTVKPESAWTSQLGDLSGKSVYNLGSPAIGLHEYLQILKNFGLEKSPDLVIMAVYEGNDLRDAEAYEIYRGAVKEEGGDLSSIPCYQSPFICRGYRFVQESFLGKKSYSFNLGLASLRWAKVWLAGALAPEISEEEQEINNFRYSVAGDEEIIQYNTENADLDEPRHAARLRQGEISLDVFNEPLKNFVNLSKDNNFVPIVVYIPATYTAYKDDTDFKDPKLKELLGWFSSEQRKFFQQQSKKLGYIFFDMTPALQQASVKHRKSEALLYFPTNLHLTALGHEVIAQSLYEMLKAIYP